MKTHNLRSIETVHDMLTWAHMVNGDIMHNLQICDLQDIYAHSHTKNIDACLIEMKAERALIICSVRNTMAFEEVERLLKVLAHHKVSKQMKVEYAELDKRESLLSIRENAIYAARKPYHKKLAELNKQVTGLQRMVDDRNGLIERMRTERNAAILEARQFEVEAGKYRQIKELLA